MLLGQKTRADVWFEIWIILHNLHLTFLPPLFFFSFSIFSFSQRVSVIFLSAKRFGSRRRWTAGLCTPARHSEKKKKKPRWTRNSQRLEVPAIVCFVKTLHHFHRWIFIERETLGRCPLDCWEIISLSGFCALTEIYDLIICLKEKHLRKWKLHKFNLKRGGLTSGVGRGLRCPGNDRKKKSVLKAERQTAKKMKCKYGSGFNFQWFLSIHFWDFHA